MSHLREHQRKSVGLIAGREAHDRSDIILDLVRLNRATVRCDVYTVISVGEKIEHETL